MSELKKAYRRMEFGLQDEVAGNRGLWVALDDVDRLKRHYPEIAKLVSEELLGGWGISHHSAIKINKATTRRRSSSSRSRKSNSLGLPLLLIFALGVGVALYLARGTKFSGKFFKKKRYPGTEIVEPYLAAGDMNGFETSMDKLMPSLLPKVVGSRKAYNEWIPYLRVLAYQREGELNGLKSKLLRGMERYAAPLDCSKRSWVRRWQGSQNEANDFLFGNKLMSSEWAQLLLWDPHWIARRNKIPGWKIPKNYYEGCLLMADKALESIISTPEGARVEGFLLFDKRMKNQLRVLNGKSMIAGGGKETTLSLVGCLETANTMIALKACTVGEKIASDWKSYLKALRIRMESALYVKSAYTLTDESMAALSRLPLKSMVKEKFTHLNYQPENQFIISILLNNGSKKEAIKRMKYEFPEVDFTK